MPEFDPDSYLGTAVAEPSFNPDEFLGTSQPATDFDPNAYLGIQEAPVVEAVPVNVPVVVGTKTPQTDRVVARTLAVADHSEAWNQQQERIRQEALDAGLPPIQDARGRLIDAIGRSEKAGYPVQHFIGKPNEPTGDRGVTMDIENLVGSLRQRAQKDPSVAQELAYWEKEAAGGMSAEDWKRQTGEPDPAYPPAEIQQAIDQQAIERNAVAPEIANNAAKGLVGALSDFIPRSVEQVAELATPLASIPRQAGQYYGLFRDLYEGKPIDESVAKNLPESQILIEAEKTPPYSEERFKAGFGLVGQMLMGAGIAKGTLGKRPVSGPKSEAATLSRPPQENAPQEAYRAQEGTIEGVERPVVEPVPRVVEAPRRTSASPETPTTQGVARTETGVDFQTGRPTTIRGFHATDRAIEGSLNPDTWFTDNSKAADFYYSGNELGKKYEADVTFKNPLVVTPEEFGSTTHGPPYWMDKAHEGGYDGVIVKNVIDGDTRSTVFAPIIGKGKNPSEFFELGRIKIQEAKPVSSSGKAPVEAGLGPVGVTETIAELQKRNVPDDRFAQYREPPTAETPVTEGAVLPVETGIPTSVKNAAVDAERANRGLPPAMESARRDFGSVWDEASNKIDADPMLPVRLTEELRENPRAVTDTENAVLLQRQIDLQNQFEKSGNELIKANAMGDVGRAAEIDAQLTRVSDDLLSIYDINKSVGGETARGLNARKMLANEDFSLARMVTRKRVAKGGEELSPIEATKIREQNQQISSLQSKIDQAELKTHFDELIAASTEEAKQAKAAKRGIGDFLEEQANKARERIKARGGRLTTGIDPIDLADHAIIGASYIAKGVTKFADWSGQMIRDFGETVKPYLQDLYKKAKELHTANSKVFTSDERRLVSAKKRTAKRIEELQGKIEAGNFTKPERPTPISDKELDTLKFQLSKVKEDYLRGVFNDQLARRSGGQKAVSAVREVMNTSRALKTSLDLSAVLRQGGLIAFGHPIRALKSFPAMIKAFGSEKSAFKTMQEIESRPNAPRYAQSKLYISDPKTTSLSKMEEVYMSRFADKIPLVGASQRAYITFLNKLRSDSWDAMAANLAKNGKPTAAEANAISNYINVASGRGTLDGLSKAAVGLNTIFFAPRYVASRFEYLAGQPFYKGTARTRTLIAKEYGRALVGLGVVYTLGKMAGATIETDPRSSDFGKIKIGNTRIDPLAGLSQTAVLASRVASGATKTVNGKIVPIRGDKVPFGTGNTADVVARFLRTKLAPIPSAGLDVATGKNVVGQSVTTQSVATGLVTPLALSDIYQTMLEQGVDKGTALGLLSIFGMGLQTYEPRESKSSKRTVLP